jgi:hypothetical protein
VPFLFRQFRSQTIRHSTYNVWSKPEDAILGTPSSNKKAHREEECARDDRYCAWMSSDTLEMLCNIHTESILWLPHAAILGLIIFICSIKCPCIDLGGSRKAYTLPEAVNSVRHTMAPEGTYRGNIMQPNHTS